MVRVWPVFMSSTAVGSMTEERERPRGERGGGGSLVLWWVAEGGETMTMPFEYIFRFVCRCSLYTLLYLQPVEL